MILLHTATLTLCPNRISKTFVFSNGYIILNLYFYLFVYIDARILQQILKKSVIEQFLNKI